MSLFVPGSDESTVASGSPRGSWRKWRLTSRWDWIWTALTVIILGGATARFVGGSWGLPLDLHPDEWVIVHGAIDMAKRNSFEPHFYARPDHVEMQLSDLAYLAYSHLLHGSPPESVYPSLPAPFLLISRTITACFGVAMIVVAYLIGRRFTRVIGVLAAFLVAFFPPLVNHSHFATPDVPLSFAFMIVILGCMRYLASPTCANLLMASLGVSVAMAIKYPGALGSLMIAISVVVAGVHARAWRRILLHGAAAIAAVVGFLLVISPVLLTNIHVVLAAFRGEAGDNHVGADGLGWSGNLRFYVGQFATAAGLILLVCFALGILWSIRLRLGQSIPLWSGAIFWVLVSILPLHWERWALPMYLTPLLVAPLGAYYSFRYILDRSAGPGRPWLAWGAVGLGALMAANLVTGSAAVTAQYVAKNTQTLGREDLAARGVHDTDAIFEGFSPLSPGQPKTIFDAFDVSRGRLVLARQVHNRSRKRYVVLSSSMDDPFKAEPRYGDEQRFYAMLDRQFPLLTTYVPAARRKPTPDGLSGSDPASLFEIISIRNALDYVRKVAQGGFSGPTIKVYKIPADRA